MKLQLAVSCLILLGACSPPDKPVIRDETSSSKLQTKEWPQKCELCGAEWTITPLDPNEVVPPTIAWCFNDGSYCDEGLVLMLKENHVLLDELLETKREFLRHCIKCKGCRYAAFDPDEWRKVTDAAQAIQAKKVNREN